LSADRQNLLRDQLFSALSSTILRPTGSLQLETISAIAGLTTRISDGLICALRDAKVFSAFALLLKDGSEETRLKVLELLCHVIEALGNEDVLADDGHVDYPGETLLSAFQHARMLSAISSLLERSKNPVQIEITRLVRILIASGEISSSALAEAITETSLIPSLASLLSRSNEDIHSHAMEAVKMAVKTFHFSRLLCTNILSNLASLLSESPLHAQLWIIGIIESEIPGSDDGVQEGLVDSGILLTFSILLSSGSQPVRVRILDVIRQIAICRDVDLLQAGLVSSGTVSKLSELVADDEGSELHAQIVLMVEKVVIRHPLSLIINATDDAQLLKNIEARLSSTDEEVRGAVLAFQRARSSEDLSRCLKDGCSLGNLSLNPLSCYPTHNSCASW
jgi:hypothetical protein